MEGQFVAFFDENIQGSVLGIPGVLDGNIYGTWGHI